MALLLFVYRVDNVSDLDRSWHARHLRCGESGAGRCRKRNDLVGPIGMVIITVGVLVIPARTAFFLLFEDTFADRLLSYEILQRK